MAAPYDLMLLLDPNVADERRSEIVEGVRGMIESNGSLTNQQEWGTRKIAFEIDHRPDAEYHLLQFEGEPALLERLSHTLKITDGVLRHRIIRAKAGMPPPPVPRPDAGRRREDGRPEGPAQQVAARAAADAPPRG